MRLVLEPDVFQAGNSIKLSALAMQAIVGRHRIEAEDDQHPRFISWLQQLPPHEKAEWDDILELSLLLEAREPARRVAKITSGPASAWNVNPQIVTLDDALLRLAAPFRVLVENNVNDRYFLLRMAGDVEKDALLALERNGLLEYEHGGGINGMPATVERFAGQPWLTQNYMVVFDSDALDPGVPSAQARRLEAVCRAVGTYFYRLNRRNIENYLTKHALHKWIYLRPGSSRAKKPIFAAYANMADDQRAHYSLKDGFTSQHSATLYASLTDDQKTALRTGFGSTICHLFRGDLVTQEHLRREGCLIEMQPVISTLLALLR